MNVNEKGDIGLIETVRDLTRAGFACFLPVGDHGPIDLIVIEPDTYKARRLQVKYRTTYRGHIDIPLASVVNGKRVPIDLEAIDGWAVYCPEIDKVVYVSKHEVDTEKGITFRLSEGAKTVSKNTVKRKLYTDFGKLDSWQSG
tara:strand:- start:62 stop:490 length:429 start_codon:yes stop_codon:yes gene_type:complete